MEIRKLTIADQPQARALGVEGFGPWPEPRTEAAPQPPTELPPGTHTWGAFDEGTLVAKVVALEFTSWFGGVEVPTCGVEGVAVAAEHRGEGLLHDLFVPVLAEAAERGEVISTLYPTANGIYRSFGYELISSYERVEIPTADLARVRRATHTTTRRATAADVPAVRRVYAAWAAAQNGPLTRTGSQFRRTPAEWLARYTGVTLATDGAGDVVGFASWDRRDGYGPHGVVEVSDLVALTADAYRALWTVVGSFTSVAGTVRVRTSGADPARLVLPSSAWASEPREQHPYMLRVDDVAAAFTALAPALPGLAPTDVDLRVAGDRFGRSDGGYRLRLGAGPGRCERAEVGDDVPTYTPQGVALAWSGAQSCANLRMLGHLTGPADHDALLDALLAGRPLHVRDYF